MQGEKSWHLGSELSYSLVCLCLFLFIIIVIIFTSFVDVCRLEFDAYRSDLEELSLGPRDAAAMVRIEMAQQEYQHHRDKYERLRSDVSIKLKFLEENKVCCFTLFLISFTFVELQLKCSTYLFMLKIVLKKKAAVLKFPSRFSDHHR